MIRTFAADYDPAGSTMTTDHSTTYFRLAAAIMFVAIQALSGASAFAQNQNSALELPGLNAGLTLTLPPLPDGGELERGRF